MGWFGKLHVHKKFMGDHSIGAQSVYGSLWDGSECVANSKRTVLYDKDLPPDKDKNTIGKPLQHTHWCNLIVDHAHVRFGHVLHDCGFNTVITVGKWYIIVNLYI